MVGIPDDVLKAYNQNKTREYYATEAERGARTGNGPAVQGAPKKVKVETQDEIKARLAEFRAKKAAAKLEGINGGGSGPGTPGTLLVS